MKEHWDQFRVVRSHGSEQHMGTSEQLGHTGVNSTLSS